MMDAQNLSAKQILTIIGACTAVTVVLVAIVVLALTKNGGRDLHALYPDQTARIAQCVAESRELGHEAYYEYGETEDSIEYHCIVDGIFTSEGGPVILWGATVSKARFR